MTTQVRVHTTRQPDSDITTFILSCNRLDLLDQTITSFMQTRDLETRIVLVDDSGVPEVFYTLVERYGDFADVICFPENRGIFWAMDFMTSYCSTPYIFYLEDDWKLLKPGYLSVSKKILEEHREIGSVDLSWRTFEEQGFYTYKQPKINDLFYYKKPWRISSNHFHWFIWQGSPNLKRREDLLILGRTETCPNEWSIDRKFYASGFQGVYVADRYTLHLGDHRSVAEAKRTREQESPETIYPETLKFNRMFPGFNYHAMDSMAEQQYESMCSHDMAFVTCLLDINRENYDSRNFIKHYVEGLYKIVETGIPILSFTDRRYHEEVMRHTGGKPFFSIPIDSGNILRMPCYPKIEKLCSTDEWVSQAPWMANSVIRSPMYLALTHLKMELLQAAIDFNVFNAPRVYWIDAGICNSFDIPKLSMYNLRNLPAVGDQLTMARFPYIPNPEIHGFNRQGYNELCGQVPQHVYRATLFGGTRTAITQLKPLYRKFLEEALVCGYLGTEESIFTGLALQQPDLFHSIDIPTGDIRHFLDRLGA